MRRVRSVGYGAILLMGLAGFAPTLGAAGPAANRRPASQPAPAAPQPMKAPTSQPAAGHRPVTLDLVQEYLKRWGIQNLTADREHQCLQFRLLVCGRTNLTCLLQVKMKKDGVTFDRLYLACADLENVPATHPRLLEVLKALATLNWQNTIGTYAWDESDGEIRLEHAMLAGEGLSYLDFKDVLDRLTFLADRDLPTIKRAALR